MEATVVPEQDPVDGLREFGAYDQPDAVVAGGDVGGSAEVEVIGDAGSAEMPSRPINI